MKFCSNGDTFASSSNDGTIKLWNPHTGECIRTLRQFVTDAVEACRRGEPAPQLLAMPP